MSLLMKINTFTGVVDLVQKIQEKKESGGQQGRRNPYGEQQQRREEKPQREATPEEVEAQVEAFGRDQQNASNGLTATSMGSGPGLRVFVKDARGAVIRDLSAAEFLEMRETALRDGRVSGKILDQMV